MTSRTRRWVTIVLAVIATAMVAAAGYRVLTPRWPAPAIPNDVDLRADLPLNDLSYNSQQRRGHTSGTQPDSGGYRSLVGTDRSGRSQLRDLAGIELLDRDPAGVPIPAGARRVRAAAQATASGRGEVGSYLASDTRDVLESFFVDAMPKAGWQLAGRRGRDMVFARPGRTCSIRLSPSRSGVELTVTVFEMR